MLDRVVIINDRSVARGGATGLALLAAELLRARQIEVTYICGDAGHSPELTAAGVEVIGLGGARMLERPPEKAMVEGLYNRRAARLLRDWIEANDTPRTAYHLHGWAQILSPAIFTPLRRVGSRLLIHAHDFFLACPNGGYVDFPRESPCRRTPMSAACILANCDKRSYGHKLWRVARQAVRLASFDVKSTGAQVAVIHEAMVPVLGLAGIPREAIRVLRNPARPWVASRIGAEDRVELLFVGRLEPEKGPDLLAAAAREANVRVRFLGDGPLKEKLEVEYPELEFEGWCSRERLARFARGARGVVVPSRLPEPFGLVILEAMGSGLPVIVTEDALLAGDIERAEAGLLVDPFDTAGFARTLARFVDDDALAAGLSRNAFTHASRLGPRPERWAEDLIHLLEGRVRSAIEARILAHPSATALVGTRRPSGTETHQSH